jgi:O-antigen ligase
MKRFSHLLLFLLVAWGAFAFGAVYAWAYWPLAAGALALGIAALAGGPPPSQRSATGLDPASKRLIASLIAFLLFGCLQTVPLSLAFLTTISPESTKVIGQLDLTVAAGVARRHATSISPQSTAVALAIFAAHIVLLVGCRRLFSTYGARRAVALIAAIGIVLAVTGIIQNRTFGGKIYGFWTPLDGGNPFGPFVNRNHFAGWMLMALPLSLGLLCAGLARAMEGAKPNWRDRLLWFSSADASRLVLLSVGAMVMALSLIMTMSRSGMLALAVAVLITAAFVARKQSSGRRAVSVVYLAALTVVAVGWAGTDTISARFSQTDWTQFNDRRGAWVDAIDIAGRFPAVGSGLNTYGIATLFYQKHNLSHHYSQAHNDYLQLAAEGGLLLVLPAMACVILFVAAVRRRFAEETSVGTYWLRLGACTALAAMALQETVDFSLQIPGNAVLFTVICAIALHPTPSRPKPAYSERA